MGLETGTYISDLVATNPLSSDGKDKGDDHLRFIKSAIKNTFTGITGAVTPTHTEFNYIAGVTSGVQTQFNAKGAIAGQVWTGAHDYTAATVTFSTQSLGDNSTKAASTAFVTQTAFSSALPAQTGNSGKGLTTDGTNASWVSFFPSIATIQTTGFAATIKSTYDCDTTSAAFTLTLPAAPADGDWISITDYAGTFATNNLTIGRNALKIMGLSENMTVATNYASFYLQYSGASKGWLIK